MNRLVQRMPVVCDYCDSIVIVIWMKDARGRVHAGCRDHSRRVPDAVGEANKEKS